MNNKKTSESRLEKLEIKVSYLENTVHELSNTLYQQQRSIETVIARNQQLLTELQVGSTGESAIKHEKPPHY